MRHLAARPPVKVATCLTCRFAALWGTAGVCRRPDAGRVTPRKQTDPFLPRIVATDHCGSWSQPAFDNPAPLWPRSRKW